MKTNTEDKRTGIEILFEERVRDTIFMTPSRELADQIYHALDQVAVYSELRPVSVLKIKESHELAQPYSILCKMGLLTIDNGNYHPTPEGKNVFKSLFDEDVFIIRGLPLD
jgi:hypothetical protein